ncbi:type II CAAX endopeptidase family protein [Chitinophaga sp.]|uniref:CPBP family intramembrane glutamic endopeptidase n=1 Tax=Chitinophaga sp. TaxID=1869181 RepID=UPI0031DE3F5D
MDNHAYPNAKDLLKLFLVLLLFMVGFGMLMGIYQVIPGVIITSSIQSLLNLIGYTLSLSATIWYAFQKSKKQHPDSFRLDVNRFPLWLIPVLIVCTLAMTVGMERLSSLIPMPDKVARFFEDLFKTDLYSIIMIAVAAPVLEETLCRGIVLKGLLQNYSPRQAIIYSSIFFALIHMNPWQSIPAFFAALFIGWIYYKTKSVIPGMIIHFVNNSTAVALTFLAKGEQDYLSWLGMPAYIVLCIAAAIVFAGSCMLIQRKIKHE